MSANQFRDQLAIRYHRVPIGLPAQCDGCGASFSLQHGLDCKKGGLVKRGQDDLRDSDAALANSAWGGVAIEPALVPEDDRHGRPALRADWMARGVWESGRALPSVYRLSGKTLCPSYGLGPDSHAVCHLPSG